jgi:hypothetical protein
MKQFEIAVEAVTDGERRWMKIVRVDEHIEVHTDKDAILDAPHVESVDEWGKALGYRISAIIGSFLHEENIV